MTHGRGHEADGASGVRETLRAEILRWNRRINLVTRQDSAPQLDLLLDQCEAGWRLLRDAVPADVLVRASYVDIGSGNGLPGLIWGAHLRALAPYAPIWLVEPRNRRAWFLRRAARRVGLDGIGVAESRWRPGMVTAASTGGVMLVSLKALRLTEPEILAGFGIESSLAAADADPVREIVIARFLSSQPVAIDDLARDLQLPDPAGRSAGPWMPAELQVLRSEVAALLVTVHRRA
jgi:hypothetical protein